MQSTFIQRFRILLLSMLLFAPLTQAQTPIKVLLSSPGPGSFSYLPIELIKKIGADQAEGIDLEVRHFGGGPLAAKEMLSGNSDFAALGMSALATFGAEGKDVRSIASISRAPTYVLSVRSGLRNQVKKIADLRGRVIGVHSSSRGNTSTSQQLVAYMLGRAGIDANQINFLAAGQSHVEQRAALASGAIDALMGEEPFTSKLQNDGLVFVLADLHAPEVTRQMLGGPFLYTQLATRGSLLAEQPEKVKRMTAAMRRTLIWIATHSPDEIAQVLAGSDLARQRETSRLLQRSKDVFSPDGAFRYEEVATTERFFHAVFGANAKARALRMNDLIDARYAGWRN